MDIKNPIIKIILFLSLCIINISNTYCQNNNIAPLYSLFDNSIEKENLEINNGVLFIDTYNTYKKSNRYFENDLYNDGTVFYNNQLYTNMLLKYDIYKDELIKKMDGKTNFMGINLIKDKIDFFYINNKKFVNLNKLQVIKPKFIDGFYEELVLSRNFILYTKYHKEKIDLISNDSVLIDFQEKDKYVIFYKLIFFEIESKKDLTSIFPNYESKINDYYFLNQQKVDNNKNIFMQNLMRYINQNLILENN